MFGFVSGILLGIVIGAVIIIGLVVATEDYIKYALMNKRIESFRRIDSDINVASDFIKFCEIVKSDNNKRLIKAKFKFKSNYDDFEYNSENTKMYDCEIIDICDNWANTTLILNDKELYLERVKNDMKSKEEQCRKK